MPSSLQGMPNNINARLMAAAGKCFGETDKRQQINNNNALERDAGNWNWNQVQCAISPQGERGWEEGGGKRKWRSAGELADNDSH